MLSDNYSYIVHCTESGLCALVDCPDAEVMIAKLGEMNLTPSLILNTHHHFDHIGGNEDLKKRWPALEIVGYRGDRERIESLTRLVDEGDTVSVGKHHAKVFFTPGHTSGHISFYFPEGKALFCGDVMFFGGCGRLFEGTPAEMYSSLQKLAALPEDTRVYCGHEYTLSNLRFARHVDPANATLEAVEAQIKALREQGQPSIPSNIGKERQINPFVRADQAALQAYAATHGADPHDPVAVFAALRKSKDSF
jgi:hydroxyacylglutathione hydrolase